MGTAVDIAAPAKVNLYLQIGERRPDGYHRLVSLFQMVSLFDHISIRSLKAENVYQLEGEFDFPVEENLITRAVRLFRERTGSRHGVRVRVKKRIPVGAGLGGGSSDAAAVIAGLNHLFAAGLDAADLRLLAAELGSDVSFFLTAAAALVRGRGEIVEPLPARSDYALVLVYPGFPVATRQAYRWLDARRAAAGEVPLTEPPDLRRIYRHASPGEWDLFNSFTPVLTERFPLLGEIIGALENAGAAAAGVSGSGSALFGTFRHREEALQAARVLKKTFPLVKFVEPLEKSPCTGLE
jgi:4-diphosphocytidyl-2-C-methyl-D-erythritol kinase